MAERIYLAANNADLGGGELMLLRHSEALRDLGHRVTVVAPDSPAEVLDAASTSGADVVAIRAKSRLDYLHRLRAWDRSERRGVLWCHGLVPALATTGHPGRIVHLHQQPRGRAQKLASRIARCPDIVTLVPSAHMATRVAGARAHANWTSELSLLDLRDQARSHNVGYVGRLSTDKGVDVLAQAMALLADDSRLFLAGDTRYVAPGDVAVVDIEIGRLGTRACRLGHVPSTDLFARVGVAVFPSVWEEPFGLVVAEAMAAGIPFVVSDAGALPEVAGPDHPWVARAGDVEDLARVIQAALDATPDEVRGVTDRSRHRWEDEYSPRAGRLRVQRLLEEVGVP